MSHGKGVELCERWQRFCDHSNNYASKTHLSGAHMTDKLAQRWNHKNISNEIQKLHTAILIKVTKTGLSCYLSGLLGSHQKFETALGLPRTVCSLWSVHLSIWVTVGISVRNADTLDT
jgi:hypothetical protein